MRDECATSEENVSFTEQVPPRLHFATNPIKIVVAQVRFQPVWTLADPSTLATVQARLRDEYPEALPYEQQMELVIGKTDPPVISPGPARFRSADTKWLVSVGQDSVSLETTDYVRWEAFRERVSKLLGQVAEYVPSQSTRVGLRYINELSRDGVATPSDWAPWLNPALASLAGGDWIGPHIQRSLQQLFLTVDADRINIRHGFIGRDQLPQDPRESVYLIDIDLYSEGGMDVTQEVLLNVFDRYHSRAWALFRGCVSDQMVEALGGEPL